MEEDKQGADEMNWRWLNEVVKVYGPFAFGVLSIMLMWAAMIKPELDARRLEFEQHSRVLQTLNEQMRDQERTNSTIHETAVVLDRVVQKLERMQGSIAVQDGR